MVCSSFYPGIPAPCANAKAFLPWPLTSLHRHWQALAASFIASAHQRVIQNPFGFCGLLELVHWSSLSAWLSQPTDTACFSPSQHPALLPPSLAWGDERLNVRSVEAVVVERGVGWFGRERAVEGLHVSSVVGVAG